MLRDKNLFEMEHSELLIFPENISYEMNLFLDQIKNQRGWYPPFSTVLNPDGQYKEEPKASDEATIF